MAHNYPDHRISSTILSTLVVDGVPGRITETPAFFLACLLMLAYASIRMYCFRTLGRLFTFQIALRKEHKLIIDGPYRFVRHPSYTGVLSGALGTLFWFGTEGSWIRECGVLNRLAGKVVIGVFLTQWIGYIYLAFTRIPIEDELLKKEFGREWEDWARDVPYLLVPGVY